MGRSSFAPVLFSQSSDVPVHPPHPPRSTPCLFSPTKKTTFDLSTLKSSPNPPQCACVSASVQTKGWSSPSLHLFQSVDGHQGASTLSAHNSPRATLSMSRAPPPVQTPQTKRTRSVTLCLHPSPPPPTKEPACLTLFSYIFPETSTP